jgi:hypothetical protein
MRDEEQQTWNISQNRNFFIRPLAQSTRRPVRNRRSGHPTERWSREKREQKQNSKIEKDSRYSFNGSVGMLFFFLANILQNIPILKVIEIKQIGVAENNVSISILYP